MAKEKMVLVTGMLIPESKKQARLNALAFGRQIREDSAKAKAEAREEEIQMMLRQGYTRSEAVNTMAVDAFNDMIARGFGKSHRVCRIQYPC